jgi:aryl-alcohol dehydrogenase-like predicted oxidoreductase
VSTRDDVTPPLVPTAAFGRTGHLSTRVIFGAAALGSMGDASAAGVLAVLDQYGINHLDTAASYGDSELRLAPWLEGRRDDFFLATKTGDRTGDEARASLERSLTRLGVDSVDLIQLHNLVEPDEWETAHGPGGAVEALVRAREEGLTRFIGVTGHGLRIAGMHRRSLERFDFDTVLLPYNVTLLADAGYRSDVAALLEVCAARNVAVQTIKSVARRRWTDNDTPHHSWYEPLRDDAAIGRAVRWVLGHEQVFLNTSSDVRLLPIILAAAASGLGPPSDAEMEADVAEQGIEPIFDGAALERI